jgi:hypothetical protein
MVLEDQSNILTATLCLLAARFTQNLPILLDFALAAPQDFYSVQLLRRLAAELLNPLTNRLPFPGKSQPNAHAVQAYNLATLVWKSEIFRNDKHIDGFSFSCPRAKRVALIRLTLWGSITLGGSSSQWEENCVVDGHLLSVKFARSSSDQWNTAVLVAGLLDGNRRLHSRDILELHRWHRELQEKWTDEYEALAQSIARRIKEFHADSSFAVLPDQLCSIVFSGISPMAARYRCCAIYLSETDPIKRQFDAIVGQSSLLELSSVIWPTAVADSTSLPKIELHLPTNNAKLSDFFSQLCEAIKLAPQQCLARPGNVMHPPGSQEALYLDVVWRQLTDDVFVNGFPSIDENCSATKLRAYQAFGVLLVSLVVNKTSLPIARFLSIDNRIPV